MGEQETRGATRHRRDIQGLRALAVTSVVLYHAGLPGLSGGFVGVDLFFVISGFLITSLLLAEFQRSSRVSLAGFWARRARRILPASTLVLGVTAAAVAVVVPALQRPAVARDSLWAGLFSANWRFARESTDYLAQQRATSPVLHYWSLGVEEQFYVGWPLLVAAAVVVAHIPTPAGRRCSPRWPRACSSPVASASARPWSAPSCPCDRSSSSATCPTRGTSGTSPSSCWASSGTAARHR